MASCAVIDTKAVLLLWADHFAGLCVCGSSETVGSIGLPSARSTSVSHSGREGGGRGGWRGERGEGRVEGGEGGGEGGGKG